MSGSGDIATGMNVYGADDQLLGRVDGLHGEGFLVGGQFIPGTAIGRIADGAVHLTDAGVSYKPQGAERGDQAETALGPLGDDSAAPDVKLSGATNE